MPFARVQNSREKGDDSDLGKTERHDAGRETGYGPKNGARSLILCEKFEVPTISMRHGGDGSPNISPTAYLGTKEAPSGNRRTS